MILTFTVRMHHPFFALIIYVLVLWSGHSGVADALRGKKCDSVYLALFEYGVHAQH